MNLHMRWTTIAAIGLAASFAAAGTITANSKTNIAIGVKDRANAKRIDRDEGFVRRRRMGRPR